MVETIRLAPHDPVPDYGNHALVLRRMGEDDPGAVVTEIVLYGAESATLPAITRDGQPMSLDQAVQAAEGEAERRKLSRVYVVDRTAGKLEQEALHDHGERNFAADTLEDSDVEDGEQGTDVRDRPHDAGFLR